MTEEQVVHKISVTIPPAAPPSANASIAPPTNQVGRSVCEVCGGPVLPNVFHKCPKPELSITTDRKECEACHQAVFPNVFHQCPPETVYVPQPIRRPFNPDECQCVWTGLNGAELYLGNKVGARFFPNEVLCVLEEPHCEQFGRSRHIHIMRANFASRIRLNEAADYIDEEMAKGAKLLVHCGAGMERSPLTVAWWLCRSGVTKTFPEAYKLMAQERPIVQNREFWVGPPFEKEEEAVAEFEKRKAVDKELETLTDEQLDARIAVNAEAAQFVTSIDPINATTEQTKYERMWGFQQYRNVAPGEMAASHFLRVAKPKLGSRIIDFGTGTGRGGMMLALVGQMRVDLVDFAANCLDAEVRAMLVTQKQAIRFFQADLSKPFPEALGAAEYGFCTDVMEHIPENEVDLVLQNILKKAQHVYFQISTTDDSCGTLIGEKLHLSVHDSTWWLKKFQSLDATVHYFSVDQGSVSAYVTAWATGQQVVDAGVLNVELETIRNNVRANMAAGWNQVSPHEANDFEIMILGGGPSLNEHLEEIRTLREEHGVKIVTLNGTYNWAREHGLQVGCQIMCDARPFNARFIAEVDPNPECKYLISSQCDPSVLAKLPRDRTFLWHTTAEDIRDILDEFGPDKWFGVPGGCTVLTRAIPLLRMLGYSQFHLFGCDSCLQEFEDEREPVHHAYSQPENDGQLVLEVIVGGRRFLCHPWMFAQAQEFISLVKVMGELFKIEVHGGGLLAYILEYGAELDLEQEQTTEFERRRAAAPVV